jgi:hypothetical protein
MKNSSDNIENGTRDLPACTAVPQPTALCVNILKSFSQYDSTSVLHSFIDLLSKLHNIRKRQRR